MAETVNLDVTTLEESVSVTTTDGGTVEVAVQAQRGETGATGATGAAGPNSVTGATTTDFTTGQVLYANGINVGSLSRSGIDTRTSFPNDDVTAATSSAVTGTLVRRDDSVAQIVVEGLQSLGPFGTVAADQTIVTKAQFLFNKSDVYLALDASPTVNRAIAFPDASGTLALTSDLAPIVISASATATAGRQHINLATATYTDPTPSEGAWFRVIVRNGAATLGGTAYATSGTVIERSYHSGAWANRAYNETPVLAANVATFLQTPSSANLAAAVTDETGTGSLVFATSPTITTPTIARSGNGTVTTFQDGSGKTVTVETASFGTQVILNGTGGTLGAYLTLNGQNESWVNVIAASNTTDLRWMRFGNGSNAQRDRFSIQRLNDTATIIRATPFSLANNAPTNSFYMESDGRIGFGTATPNARAIIDLTSTTQGFLPPRMTTAQRDAISSPPAGLMIYNTTTNKLNVYTTAWEAITSA